MGMDLQKVLGQCFVRERTEMRAFSLGEECLAYLKTVCERSKHPSLLGQVLAVVRFSVCGSWLAEVRAVGSCHEQHRDGSRRDIQLQLRASFLVERCCDTTEAQYYRRRFAVALTHLELRADGREAEGRFWSGCRLMLLAQEGAPSSDECRSLLGREWALCELPMLVFHGHLSGQCHIPRKAVLCR